MKTYNNFDYGAIEADLLQTKATVILKQRETFEKMYVQQIMAGMKRKGRGK